jgi:hypothetical protein
MHGKIAAVWTSYEFCQDGKASHYGIDAFELVRRGQWLANRQRDRPRSQSVPRTAALQIPAACVPETKTRDAAPR